MKLRWVLATAAGGALGLGLGWYLVLGRPFSALVGDSTSDFWVYAFEWGVGVGRQG